MSKAVPSLTLAMSLALCVSCTELPSGLGEGETVPTTRAWLTERQQLLGNQIGDCLEEAGFSMVVDEDGGYGPAPGAVAPGQESAFEEADRRCEAEVLAANPPPPPPRSRADWEDKHRNQLEIAACLEALGYQGQEPTLDSYIDSAGGWTAYDRLGRISREEWQTITSTCPE